MNIQSKPLEIETLYKICGIISQDIDSKEALKNIIEYLHEILIFDNFVVYKNQVETSNLEVLYARSKGRGKSHEADIAWGEDLANSVFEKKALILDEPNLEGLDRYKNPFLLGMPIVFGKSILGILLIIRYGGPHYNPSEIQLVEHIAHQISILLEKQNIVKDIQVIQDWQNEINLKEDFLSTITHELRSPLGFIKGYTTTLLRADTSWDKESQTEFLQIIDQETDYLQELIGNLLDSARLQSGHMKMTFQPIRLESNFTDAIARARFYQNDLVAEVKYPPDISPIQADPQRLTQVFENLLTNAIKYAPGSPISITIEQEDTFTLIHFSDQGPGIPDKYLPHIFERFFRNPENANKKHGTGLGLYICKQIIIAHHGQISATSESGKGTTFHISLPREFSE
ncbi:MAG: GAF domain-containing protein [Anaerolineaceae bacterium]|nr:GAF domain-containing protein [Anaerolineaceae bacterium]